MFEIRFDEYLSWCQGVIISNVSEFTIKNLKTDRRLLTGIAKTGGCLGIITVNEQEVKVCKFLEKYGWKASEKWPNYIHNGRLTWMYTKMISEEMYRKYELKRNEHWMREGW
jgi:hypothetical protein